MSPKRSKLVIGFFVFLALLMAAIPAYIVIEEIVDDGEYAFLYRRQGRPIVWDPCAPVRYVVNDTFAPEGGLDDLRESVRRVEEATGLDLVDVGRVAWTIGDYRRARGVAVGGDGGATYAPVLITWEGAETFRRAQDAYGVANPFPGQGGSSDRFVAGFIAMNVAQPLPSGFDRDGSWGPVLMHELGHLVGLNHVSRLDEVMAPGHVPPWPTDWGEGDRRGLVRLGQGTCRETDPTPLTVPSEPLDLPAPGSP